MKKMLKNKKGFTLIELLAVIVVLAIIMVIATQQVNKTIQDSRANSFISSYQMVIKQIKLNVASGDTVACSTVSDCRAQYGLSDDYDLVVDTYSSPTDSGYNVFFSSAGVVNTSYPERYYGPTSTPTPNKKFSNLDLSKYGNTKCSSSSTTTSGNISVSGTKHCYKNFIKGYVSISS